MGTTSPKASLDVVSNKPIAIQGATSCPTPQIFFLSWISFFGATFLSIGLLMLLHALKGEACRLALVWSAPILSSKYASGDLGGSMQKDQTWSVSIGSIAIALAIWLAVSLS